MTSIADLANLAAETTDHTETTQGGDFEYTPAPVGKTVGRFIEYIELGKQKQRPYQGKPKADAEEARITFELVAPKNIKEIDVEGGKKKIADRVSFNIAIKLGDKAGFKKLFETMRRGRETIKHMAQMLGEGFIIEIVHNEQVVDGKKTGKVFANMKTEAAGWLIAAPVIEDPIAGTKTNVPVPEALSPMKLFLWDHPNKETWDSIFIDGTRTVKKDGVDVEQSKNWLQHKIMEASNYGGSKLEAMLAGVDNLSIDPETTDTIPEDNAAANQTVDGAAHKATEALAAKQATEAKAAAQTAVSGLAALGL